MDAGAAELVLSDDPFDCTKINIDHIPILVTVSKIGEACVVDPSAEEEECSSASLVIGASQKNGKTFMTNTQTIGRGSFHPNTMFDSIKLGLSASKSLDDCLVRALKLEENRVEKDGKKTVGFLHS
uniref:Exoribonuclease phosphorolytic domain-containing protein n=1 Tax=Megaselia scalaris TaxID=36166 RepID=T1GUE4_MEGSC